jgi:hypothetical protein
MNTSGSSSYACPYCGFTPAHSPEQCWRVKAIEYFPNGAIKRVEKTPESYSGFPTTEIKVQPY